MIVICDKCNTKYKLNDATVTEEGVKVRCSKCGNTFIVKKPGEEDIQKITHPESYIQSTDLQPDINSNLDKVIDETISDINAQEPEPKSENTSIEFDWSGLSENEDNSQKKETSSLEWSSELQLSQETDLTKAEEPEKEDDTEKLQNASPLYYEEPEVSSSTIEHVVSESIKQDRRVSLSVSVLPFIKKAVTLSIVLLSVAVISYFIYVYRTQLSDFSYDAYRTISGYTTTQKTLDIGVGVSNSKGYFLKNIRGQQLFIIEGNVTNVTAHPISFIKLTAKISDNKNNIISSKSFYAGNILSDNELRTFTSDQINLRLNNQMGQSLKNFNVIPNASLPFMVVFFDVPDNITSFTVIPTNAHPGVQ